MSVGMGVRVRACLSFYWDLGQELSDCNCNS